MGVIYLRYEGVPRRSRSLLVTGRTALSDISIGAIGVDLS